jgi:hypothetical protein
MLLGAVHRIANIVRGQCLPLYGDEYAGVVVESAAHERLSPAQHRPRHPPRRAARPGGVQGKPLAAQGVPIAVRPSRLRDPVRRQQQRVPFSQKEVHLPVRPRRVHSY